MAAQSSATGTIDEANDAVTVDATSADQFAVSINSTTASLNVSWEATWDGTNWDAITAFRRDATGSTEATSQTIGNSQSWVFAGSTYGALKVRARCSSYTSGSCTVTVVATSS